MFREVYAYYSLVYCGPDGNLGNYFHVSQRLEKPLLIEGVPIPEDKYTVRKELEIDLGMCTPRQFRGILGKFRILGWIMNLTIALDWSITHF